MIIKFKRLSNGEGLPLPRYATAGAAAMDICSAEDAVLNSGERRLFKTGFACAIPEGYELQVRPRSGLALKLGLTVVNTPGTIDSDYRGEIGIILLNTNPKNSFDNFIDTNSVEIARGDRIAQLVLAPVTQGSVEEVDELDETTRGAGGFGSTGRN